jgi:hypothetical protein
LVYSWTLKMEEICSSETSVDFQRSTRRYIPEDCTLVLKCLPFVLLIRDILGSTLGLQPRHPYWHVPLYYICFVTFPIAQIIIITSNGNMISA